MKTGIIFMIFGLIIIFFPEFIAYLLGAFLILVGINILFISKRFGNKDKDYVKFGDYKIYRKK